MAYKRHPVWHSGQRFSPVGNAYVLRVMQQRAAFYSTVIVVRLQRKVHKIKMELCSFSRTPSAAVNAFQGPIGFQIGTRNILRGPQYSTVDAGLAKTFKVVPDWGLLLKLTGRRIQCAEPS